MIRDRGRIKWTSMMLPEHVKMLREWAEEDTRTEREEPDEQKLEQLNETAEEAMERGKEVSITHFSSGHYEEAKGRIHYFDALRQEFRIVDRDGAVRRISLGDIDQIQITE
ncbi:MAG TPA: YolD-like family protein [Bacillaceae bacterium]